MCFSHTHHCDLHKSCDFWQAFVFAVVRHCWLFATHSPTKKFKLPGSTCLFANLCIQTCYSFNFPFLANVEFTILRSGCDDRYKTHAGSTNLHAREFPKIILHTVGIVRYELICPQLCTCPGCRGQLCLAASGMREQSMWHSL